MILSPATNEPIFDNPEHPIYRIRDHIPLGRVGEPEDVARCALFLASDDSSYMTAANLVLDCGWSSLLPGAEPQTGGSSVLTIYPETR
jgi:meso-butanediol dehydrogenase/(S,S)-butanediol dehydrogenase/diacetyl reductase